MRKLSIITINYNNKDGLQTTIESVINQTNKNFEFIVIDGGSTDGSVEIIDKNKTDIDIWISEKDNGIYDAINKGINTATGTYLMFLNSGDYLSANDTINLYDKYILDYPGTDIFYGDIVILHADSNTKYIHKHPENLDLAFFQKDTLNHQASLIKSELFKDFGCYPLEYTLASDYWLYVKCIIESRSFVHVNHPTIIYDFNGQSTTNRVVYLAEMNLIWEKLVPKYAQKLTSIVNDFKLLTGYKIVKTAINLNSKIQKLRNKS
ncbi:glycosyltransferase family 2 protein [Mucilaginibacter sp. L196]|uniref:glycosyltransferase family 2 protein n=1 Tax=Mucilaginibacter sp. L196 TaxID=1641870 RepID=UPI00131B4087|nr:glycosyltransferase family 2 protein [Mucilaginibacter sp. L196]